MNISFSEILLTLFIALLVIKPDRLPQFAFTLGRFFRKLQRLHAKIKNISDMPFEKYTFDQQPKIISEKATVLNDSDAKG